MVIPKNRRLFDPLPARPVSYCILDAHPSSLQDIKSSFNDLKEQSTRNWKAVYLVASQQYELLDYVESQQKSGWQLELLVHSGSVGRNYETAIINACPNKSFVVVLRSYERLIDRGALESLAKSLEPRPVLGAFVALNISGQIRQPTALFEDYNKLDYNAKEPKYDSLNTVLNQLRVFHSDCYKIIPQFVLKTPEGVYFNDRFTFLEQFLFMVRSHTGKHDDTEIEHTQKVKWFIKSNSDIFDVPNRIIATATFVISSDQW